MVVVPALDKSDSGLVPLSSQILTQALVKNFGVSNILVVLRDKCPLVKILNTLTQIYVRACACTHSHPQQTHTCCLSLFIYLSPSSPHPLFLAPTQQHTLTLFSTKNPPLLFTHNHFSFSLDNSSLLLLFCFLSVEASNGFCAKSTFDQNG